MPIITSSGNLEYFDGFDDYNTAQMNRYWTNPGGGTIGAGGRNGTNGLTVNNVNGPALTVSPQQTRTVGFAFNIGSFYSGAFNQILAFQDGGGTVQIDLHYVQGTGQLQVTRNGSVNGGGTVLGTSTYSLQTNIWYFIEMSAVIASGTSGSFIVKVNGGTWLNVTGVNTQQSGNSYSNFIFFGYSGNSVNYIFDDIYIRKDGTFLGDCRSETHLPTGNGASNVWIPSAGSNYQNVNHTVADDDTTYNSSANAGDTDLYTYSPLSVTGGSVYAVMVVPTERVDTSGIATSCSVYRSSGGTIYPGGTQNVGSTSYAAYPDIQGLDPSTGAAWTIAGVNAFQYGLRRLS